MLYNDQYDQNCKNDSFIRVNIAKSLFFGIKDYLMGAFVSEYHLRYLQRDDV